MSLPPAPVHVATTDADLLLLPTEPGVWASDVPQPAAATTSTAAIAPPTHQGSKVLFKPSTRVSLALPEEEEVSPATADAGLPTEPLVWAFGTQQQPLFHPLKKNRDKEGISELASAPAAPTTTGAPVPTPTPPTHQSPMLMGDVLSFKTRMCKNHAEAGSCRYGARCRFAHGDCDMRTQEQNFTDGLVTEQALVVFLAAMRHRGDSALPMPKPQVLPPLPSLPPFGLSPMLAADATLGSGAMMQFPVFTGMPGSPTGAIFYAPGPAGGTGSAGSGKPHTPPGERSSSSMGSSGSTPTPPGGPSTPFGGVASPSSAAPSGGGALFAPLLPHGFGQQQHNAMFTLLPPHNQHHQQQPFVALQHPSGGFQQVPPHAFGMPPAAMLFQPQPQAPFMVAPQPGMVPMYYQPPSPAGYAVAGGGMYFPPPQQQQQPMFMPYPQQQQGQPMMMMMMMPGQGQPMMMMPMPAQHSQPALLVSSREAISSE